MNQAKGDNIIPAMQELAERRDAGELVHVILQEVAQDYGLPAGSLQRRAEASWGAPLESDRERHAAHFEYVETNAAIVREARQLARAIWHANRPYAEQHSWWRIAWKHELDQALKSANLPDPEFEAVARTAFMDEVRRMGAPLEI